MQKTIIPILNDLKKGLRDTLASELIAIYLYGSRARGDAHPDSDIDVLIVVDDDNHYMDLLERTAPVICKCSLFAALCRPPFLDSRP